MSQNRGYLFTSHGAELQIERNCFFFDTDGPGIDPVLLDGTYGVAPAVDSKDNFLTMAHGPVIP